jgi:hypothetical protein
VLQIAVLQIAVLQIAVLQIALVCAERYLQGSPPKRRAAPSLAGAFCFSPMPQWASEAAARGFSARKNLSAEVGRTLSKVSCRCVDARCQQYGPS